MSKIGRPRKEIDKMEFEKLCGLQCTKVEICAWFDMCDETLDRWIKEEYGNSTSFSEVFGQKRSAGKISLRRNQWKMSEKNVAMAIWLGKQFLDQKDLARVETVNIDGPVFVDDDE